MVQAKPNSATPPSYASRLWTLLVMLMAVGTLVELALMGHYEEVWQWPPMVLLGLSLVSFLALVWRPGSVTRRVFRGLMLLCGLSGLIGTWLHLQANWEFERELHPTASAWNTFTDSLTGALPALAPFSMVVFALLGYLYTLYHIQKQA